jgi:hypothetical protein
MASQAQTWRGTTAKVASERLPITANPTVLNTYRVWLRYELFRGGLSYEGFRASEDNLTQFIAAHGNSKPHLTELLFVIE